MIYGNLGGPLSRCIRGGRVPKFKHQLYEWMGVNAAELAVMAELLLRGEQTLGELRARASRMTRISDLGELRTNRCIPYSTAFGYSFNAFGPWANCDPRSLQGRRTRWVEISIFDF